MTDIHDLSKNKLLYLAMCHRLWTSVRKINHRRTQHMASTGFTDDKLYVPNRQTTAKKKHSIVLTINIRMD